MKRTMKTVGAAVACVLLGLPASAEGQATAFGSPAKPAVWTGLTDANWLSGPKITAADLEGKVVLVDEWGLRCPPCRALLPRMEQVWRSFSAKPFVLLGSHRQARDAEGVAALVKANGLTYPVYQDAGMEVEPDNGGGLPFLYVVDGSGQVVYSGRDEREAEAALVNAITDIPHPDALLGNVQLKKFKSLEKCLLFGQNVEAKLAAVRTAARNPARPEGQEAAAILQAVSNAQLRIEARIRKEIPSLPGTALTDIQKHDHTWPSSASVFAAEKTALSANPEVRKLQQLDQALSRLESKSPRGSGQAKTLLTQAEALKKANAELAESKDEAVAREAKQLLTRLDRLSAGLAAEAAPAKRR